MIELKNLLEMSHRISKYTVGGEGNTSARTEGGFYIKASGFGLSTLKEEEIIKCDLDGNQMDNFHLKPSLETAFHSLIYKTTNNSFIAHTHPVETLKILCSDKIQDFASTRLFPDQVVFNGLESCIVEYAHPGEELMNSIKKSCENYVDKRKYFPSLILLQNHGILCASNSMKNCVFATEICEKSAAVFLSAGSNSLTYLNEDQKEKIFYDKKEKYRINL